MVLIDLKNDTLLWTFYSNYENSHAISCSKMFNVLGSLKYILFRYILSEKKLQTVLFFWQINKYILPLIWLGWLDIWLACPNSSITEFHLSFTWISDLSLGFYTFKKNPTPKILAN